MTSMKILSETGSFEVPATEGLWLSAADTERVTGWSAKPEGLCRADECVPMPAAAKRDGSIDVEAFWRLRGAPVLHSEARDLWVLGESADGRNRALADETAPDFTLPDLDGKPCTLSALRGKKVFLVTWASW